ncbi:MULTISPECIES: condensation domain-containing protein [Vibrio]|uniref:Enterobactin synthase n=2 Tax=Vibrio TaxID=662 RepID=A0A2N7NPS1_9VIBR|nr:condensation domain-containing protein [Vibrio tasmaniensis]PMP18900.1 enterobactin synthase [Vibrio tasmaniensis]TKG30815.1 enterobactin synthase [Vibrio tasmaniensis]TKG40097.1 enterobactin synthase [Vibrio tasmaniensis]TKG46531.1 enterobactin synthase [Vibrio tasmaniensis]TKG50318.1 enterobactin synthase [Vibrio tasmaniensis]
MTRQDWYPLTNAQEAYWDEFVQHPDRPLSTVAHCLEISGSIDLEKLADAINQTVSEAEALLLRFRRLENQYYPVQMVCFDEKPTVEVIDLRGEENAQEQVNAYLRSDVETAIDLEKDVITKVQLYIVGSQKVFWYLRTHHIAVDGYSMSLIEQRCSELYLCLVNNTAPKHYFKTFEVYLKENTDYLDSDRFDVDRSYWGNYLDSANLTLSNHDISVSDTVYCERDVPESICDSLITVSKQLMIGWSDILTLLCTAYLYRHWRSDEQTSFPLPVWLPFMNRMGNPCANLPSLMVNTIPYIGEVADDESVDSYLRRAVKELRGNYCHGRYRVENKCTSGGHYFISPFINILPFESTEFHGCSTKRRIIAGGIADGFNVTFRGSRQAKNMSLKIEAESSLFELHELTDHANHLLKYLSKALNSVLD